MIAIQASGDVSFDCPCYFRTLRWLLICRTAQPAWGWAIKRNMVPHPFHYLQPSLYPLSVGTVNIRCERGRIGFNLLVFMTSARIGHFWGSACMTQSLPSSNHRTLLGLSTLVVISLPFVAIFLRVTWDGVFACIFSVELKTQLLLLICKNICLFMEEWYFISKTHHL